MPARAITVQPCPRGAACRRSADSPDRGSACQSVLTHRVREHVFERRHARPQVPHLDALGRRQREQLARAAFAGHEHAHDVLVGRMALEAGRAQPLDERLELAGGVFTRSS